jgi:hypothetical protein
LEWSPVSTQADADSAEPTTPVAGDD